MSHSTWQEQFKDQIHGLEEFYQASGSVLSLLGYALLENRIKPEEYFSWAMKNHGLPLLHSHFYTETPPSLDFYQRWSTHYSWSAECLPVGEWEGSLIVACLAPPQDFPPSPSTIFVLSSLTGLQECWTRFTTAAAPVAGMPAEVKSARANTPPALDVDALPEGIDVTMATAISSKPSDSFSVEELEVSESSESVSAENELKEAGSNPEISEENSPAAEQIEGLFDDHKVTALHSLKPLSAAPEAATTVAPATSEVAAAPAETVAETKNSLLKKNEDAASIAEKAAEKTVIAPREDLPAEPAAQAAPSLKVVPPPPKATLPSESATVVAAIPAPPREDSFVDVAVEPVAAANKEITPSKVVLSSFNGGGTFVMEKWKKKNLFALSDSAAKILTEMKHHFEKSLILSFDDKETQLIPFAWDETAKDVKETTRRVPMHSDSIFSIVKNTQKPFHGYISMNDINEKFFEDWNNSRVPDHVTLVPIFINQQLAGVLMGLGNKTAYNKITLSETERLSSQFTQWIAEAKVA